jgi:uncharacterized membrane protein
MRGFYFIPIFSVLFLGSCTYHELKNAGAASGSDAFGAQSTVNADLIQQSVLNTCLHCHAGNTPPSLGSIDDIRANIGRVQIEVNSNQMPPSGSGYPTLSDCQKAILQEWVSEGMPATSDKKIVKLSACQQGVPPSPTPTPSTPILDMPVNYQTLNSEILQPRCVHCHSSGSGDPDASLILLVPYSAITGHGTLLGADSAHSRFVTLVTRTDDSRMPPPEDSDPLSADQQEFIRRWIDAGHPEN